MPKDGDEDKNYNRIQSDRWGCGWGQYSGDWLGMGTVLVGERGEDWYKTVSFFTVLSFVVDFVLGANFCLPGLCL